MRATAGKPLRFNAFASIGRRGRRRYVSAIDMAGTIELALCRRDRFARASGNASNRAPDQAAVDAASFSASDQEARSSINRNRLAGTGIGLVDAHLFASAMLAGARRWTRDRRTAEAASPRVIAIDG